MTELNTRTRRDIRGRLSVETRITLDGNRRLEIDTYKSESGPVVTYATVFHLKDDGSKIHAIFKDYSKTFAKEKIRATEKALRAQHDTVLTGIDTILADVTRHYVGEPALLA